MPDPRPTPFDLVFAGLAGERFGTIREALAQAGADPFDRDAVLMSRPAIELIRELRPEDGVGEGMEELVALTHAAYAYWHDGARMVRIGPAAVERLLAAPPQGGQARPPIAYYAQFPARRIWGAPVAGEAHEPLDGCFVLRAGQSLSVAAVFGLHPGRDGFSVVAVEGPRPSGLARGDGTPLFAPALPGGAAAGLHSVTGMEELLELAWRTDDLLAGRDPGPGLTEIS
jgi:hypothetical protein